MNEQELRKRLESLLLEAATANRRIREEDIDDVEKEERRLERPKIDIEYILDPGYDPLNLTRNAG